MKDYFLVGNKIGISVYAENAQEAMEIAEAVLLQGLGGDISFCDEEDRREYEESE
jgi:hypothetical protein